jgi:acid stress chaperone HdeA
MKTLIKMSLVVALATAQGLSHAQPMNAAPKKPITQTSCKDYLAMDEVIKPKFIYYVMGYFKGGKPIATSFDVVGVEKTKPVIDEYCRVHLSESAYKKLMDESMASEKAHS